MLDDQQKQRHQKAHWRAIAEELGLPSEPDEAPESEPEPAEETVAEPSEEEPAYPKPAWSSSRRTAPEIPPDPFDPARFGR